MNETKLSELVKDELMTEGPEIDLTPKQLDSVFDTYQKVMGDVLASGEDLRLHKFGRLKIVNRAARSGVMNGKAWSKAASKAVSFTPYKQLKEQING